MPLLLELLAVLSLTSGASALPQIEPQANLTAPTLEPIDPSEPAFPEPTFPPSEEFEEPWEDPCWTISCIPLNFIPDLPTASGWEVDDNTMILGPSNLAPPEQTPVVVTTRFPTIIAVQTNIAPTITREPPTGDPTGNRQVMDKPSEQVDVSVQPRPSGIKAENAPDGPVPFAQHAEGDDLLQDVISRMDSFQTNAQPVQASSLPVPHLQGEHDPVSQQVTSGDHGVVTPQATFAMGASVTLGSATLTLTPGLSTMLRGETFLGITTNDARQTIITIASSGTSITATVTDASATMTMPKTGFEASITAVARPGTLPKSVAAGDAVSTSSKAGAVSTRGELNWCASVVLGILGAIVA